MPISPRQQRALTFIEGYIASNRQAPTIREIAEFVGYRSLSGTHEALKNLEHRGLIKRNRDRAWRDLEIIEPSEPAVKTLICGKCKLRLPVTEFGICRSRRTGRNCYCRRCVRDKVYASRERVREMKRNRKAVRERDVVVVDRKPEVMSPMIKTVVQRVNDAIWSGCRTREEIATKTKLPMDDICDALAVLKFDRGVVRSERVKGEAMFYPVRAA